MSSGSWEHLVEDLRTLSGWDGARVRETLVSVLCVLDQSLFCNGRNESVPIATPFRLLRRCPHHRGVRPRSFSQEALVRMVADDLNLSPTEAEESIRLVLAAMQKQMTARECFLIRQWLPEEICDYWPADEPAPLQP